MTARVFADHYGGFAAGAVLSIPLGHFLVGGWLIPVIGGIVSFGTWVLVYTFLLGWKS